MEFCLGVPSAAKKRSMWKKSALKRLHILNVMQLHDGFMPQGTTNKGQMMFTESALDSLNIFRIKIECKDKNW